MVDHLAKSTRCLALFATHYHSLVEEWGGRVDCRLVGLGHMACVVGEGEDDITFLYRLAPGSSPRSFGINVARLARLPPEILALAAAKSSAFEDSISASADWQQAVAIGRRLLESAMRDDTAADEITDLWRRAKALHLRFA